MSDNKTTTTTKYQTLYKALALTIALGCSYAQASSIDPATQTYYTLHTSGTIIGNNGNPEYLNNLKINTMYSSDTTSRYFYGVLANNNINLYLQTPSSTAYNIEVTSTDATRNLYTYGLKTVVGKTIIVNEGSLRIAVDASIATPAAFDTSRNYVYGINAAGDFGNNAYINTTVRGGTATYVGNNFGEVYNYGIYGLTPNSSQFGDNTTVNLRSYGSHLDTAAAQAKVVQAQSFAYGITNATLGTNTTINIINQDDGTHFARAANVSTVQTNAYATADARSIGIQDSIVGEGLSINIKNKSGTSETTTNLGLNKASIAQSNVIVNTTGVLNTKIGNNATIELTNQAGQATALILNDGNMPKATASVYAYGIKGNSTAGDNTTIRIDSTAGHSITKGVNGTVNSHTTQDSYSFAETENHGVTLENTTVETATLGNNTNIQITGKGGIAQDYTNMTNSVTGTSATASIYGASTTGNTASRILFGQNTNVDIQAIGGTATSNGNNAYAEAIAIGLYGNITTQGSTTIHTDTIAGLNNNAIGNRYGYALYTTDPAHKLYINRADSNTGNNYIPDAQIKITGDIVSYGGEIRITAENPGSYINGTIIQDPVSKIFLNLDKQAQWNLTPNTYLNQANTIKPIITLNDAGYTTNTPNSIDIYSLQVGNQVQINLTSDNATRTYNSTTDNTYRTLTSEGGNFNITGTGNTFILNTDIAHNIADKLTIDSSAAGTNYIKVNYDPSMSNNIPVTTPYKALVVQAKPGASAANFQGNFVGVTSEYGAYSWTPTVLQDGLDWYITTLNIKASRTVMTAADALRTMDYMLSHNHEDLTKRMGDLRLGTRTNQDLSGLWAKYDHGSTQSGSGRTAELKHNRFTLGYDRAHPTKTGKTHSGISISQLNGSSHYQTGSGKDSSTMLGLYHTWLGDKGHYYDIVLKTGRIKADYGMFDLYNNYSTTAISTWGSTISGEYGYRKTLSHGIYIEPQIQILLGRTNAYTHTTSAGLNIQADANNIAIARIGFNLGKQYNNSSIYLRANYFHNLAGNSNVVANGLAYHRDDQLKNWYELGIGASWKTAKNNTIYIEADKYFGDLKNSINLQIGTRWSW